MKREGGRKDRARTVAFGDAPTLDLAGPPRVDLAERPQEAPAAAGGGSGPNRTGTVKDFRALFDSQAKKDKEEKEKSSEKESKSGLKLFHFRVGEKKSPSPQASPAARESSKEIAAPPGEERKWKLKLDAHKAEQNKKPPAGPTSPTGPSPRTPGAAPLSPRQMHYNGTQHPVASPNPVRRDSISGPKGNIKQSVALAGPPLSPSASKEAKEEFKVNQLICAFEAAFIKNPRADLSVLDQSEWDDLFRAQTMKKRTPKEKSSVFGLFGGGSKDDDEEKEKEKDSPGAKGQELDQMMLAKQKETWDSLDSAKKKRRLQEFLKKRAGVREMLEEDLRLHAGLASPVDDTQDYPALAQELPPPLLRVPCPGHKLELGIFPSTVESQLKYLPLEDAEKGDAYYRDFFHGKDHHNYIAVDPQGFHVIVSLQTGDDAKERANARVMVRTKDGAYCTFVPADPDSKAMIKSLCEGNEALAPYTGWKRIKDADKTLEKSLLGLEKQMLMKRSKFGIVYVKNGQNSENDFYNNREADMSEQFIEFLDWIATKVVLQGWTDFNGGLDVRNNSTGTHSYYTRHRGIEVMFHVAPFLPHFDHDVQHLEKKRHIGNDIAALVFLDDVEQPFDPNAFVSEFLHIFAFVSLDRAKMQETGQVHYRLAFASREVDLVMPIIPYPGSFPRNEQLRDFLITKLLNAERGALHAPVFEAKMVRTRKQLLGDLANDVGFGGK